MDCDDFGAIWNDALETEKPTFLWDIKLTAELPLKQHRLPAFGDSRCDQICMYATNR